MKLCLKIGYSGREMGLPLDLIRRAEALGYYAAWTSEAYGSDAVAPAAWILANTTKIKVGTAIMQMPARTPAMTAMTAMTLASLSGNRFILGLGASGPQVVEGWHGVRFGRPVTRLKEYVAVLRKIFAREAPLAFEGKEYQIPYRGEGSTGLGKPLKSILHCDTPIPIYAATLTPAGVEAAAEVADGFFPIWLDPEQYGVFREPIEKGFAKAGGKTLANFDVAPFVTVIVGDDVERCMQPIRAAMALYIGGMGARGGGDPDPGPLSRRPPRGSGRCRARRADRCLSPGGAGRAHPRTRTALGRSGPERPRRLDADRHQGSPGPGDIGKGHRLSICPTQGR
jgi:F420-dependent oxidoreductase-like protein